MKYLSVGKKKFIDVVGIFNIDVILSDGHVYITEPFYGYALPRVYVCVFYRSCFDTEYHSNLNNYLYNQTTEIRLQMTSSYFLNKSDSHLYSRFKFHNSVYIYMEYT